MLGTVKVTNLLSPISTIIQFHVFLESWAHKQRICLASHIDWMSTSVSILFVNTKQYDCTEPGSLNETASSRDDFAEVTSLKYWSTRIKPKKRDNSETLLWTNLSAALTKRSNANHNCTFLGSEATMKTCFIDFFLTGLEKTGSAFKEHKTVSLKVTVSR